jgi:hypothetical protein
MMVGGVEYSGIGEPFASELGTRCTLKAGWTVYQGSNYVDPIVELTYLSCGYSGCLGAVRRKHLFDRTLETDPPKNEH